MTIHFCGGKVKESRHSTCQDNLSAHGEIPWASLIKRYLKKYKISLAL